MKHYINYSLSVEKGLCGNIGKMTVSNNAAGQSYMNVMLFLSGNSDSVQTIKNRELPVQIINVHFPESAFAALKLFETGDLVRVIATAIQFLRIATD